MREDQVRRYSPLEVFEVFFYLTTLEGEIAVPEFFDDDLPSPAEASEFLGTLPRLLSPGPLCPEDYPMDYCPGILFTKAKNRASTADLDIIWVSAQAENLKTRLEVGNEFA